MATYETDEIIEKAPNHPITSTLLMISAIALILGMVLIGAESKSYLSPTRDIKDKKVIKGEKNPLTWAKNQLESQNPDSRVGS